MYIKYYNYDVYPDGKVYSNYTNKYLKGDIVQGYLQYTLAINKKPIKIKAHKLVAKLYLPLPDDINKKIINHKDGNKLNNYYKNLE